MQGVGSSALLLPLRRKLDGLIIPCTICPALCKSCAEDTRITWAFDKNTGATRPWYQTKLGSRKVSLGDYMWVLLLPTEKVCFLAPGGVSFPLTA